MIFSHVFLPILHNIGLYIYTIRYRSDIKTLGFLLNDSKKKFKLISSLMFFCFYVYVQILKFFQEYFHKKKQKLYLSHIFKMQKIDIITSLWLFVRIWLKCQKSFTIHFGHFLLEFRCRL